MRRRVVLDRAMIEVLRAVREEDANISEKPPGPASTVSASARASDPPKPIASERNSASRPTVARWIPRCVTPEPHSWIDAYRTCAPSPT